MTSQPASVWTLVLIGVVGVPALATTALYRGARASGAARRTARALAAASAVAFTAWAGAATLLADATAFSDDGRAAPWFGAAFAAMLAGLLLATRIPVVARALRAPGIERWLVAPHAVRVVGIVFVLVLLRGDLPAVFALPAGLGDVAVGISALMLLRTRADRREQLPRFHLLGTLDLAVALAIGFLAGLGPYRPFDVSPSTEALSLLPLALVPTVAVPTAIALHVVALMRPSRAVRRPSTVTAPAAAGAPPLRG